MVFYNYALLSRSLLTLVVLPGCLISRSMPIGVVVAAFREDINHPRVNVQRKVLC